jgi:antitoxin (DNA-binding transcriptional repressor) of toxin-antitoxin stability system
MSPTDYGPVPVSRVKAESGAIFDALAHGRRVLIAKHDRVVAAIDPATAVPRDLLVDYATPGHTRLAELTATEINQGSPSRAVAAASTTPAYVTKDNRVYGLLRQITADDLAAALPSPALIAERERRIEKFLADHPEAGAEELASVGERLNAELGIGATGHGHYPAPGLLDPRAATQLREQILTLARTYAQQAGALITEPVAVSADAHAALTHAIEVRVTEAMATATEETLSGFAARTRWAYGNATDAIAVDEERANAALDELTQGIATP